MSIGRNEVRITKVWTLETASEFSTEHDPTPNWKENDPLGGPTFALRFHAEAGRNIGATGPGATYTVAIYAVCLSTPAWSNLLPMQPLQPPEALGGPTAWESQAHEEMFTRDWRIVLPAPPVGFFGQQIWQYHVLLVGTGVAPFSSTGISEPFLLR